MCGVQFNRRNAESIGDPKGGIETDDFMLSLRSHGTSKENVKSDLPFKHEIQERALDWRESPLKGH